MIWRNPWAWLGLAALALPILVHLLGQRRRNIHKFPTLRFLGDAQPLQTKRSQLNQIVLLAVRLGILLAAIAALANPLFMSTDRYSRASAGLVRAILVDTSASMRLTTAGGENALTRGTRIADSLAALAIRSIVVRSGAPAEVLRGMESWLDQEIGARELVVISDFQNGEFGPQVLSATGASHGLRLVRIDRASTIDAPHFEWHDAAGKTTARVTFDSAGENIAQWTLTNAPDTAGAVELLVGAKDSRAAAALRAAAMRYPGSREAASSAADRPVAILFPSYAGRDSLLRLASSPSQRWMGDILLDVNADPLVSAPLSAASATLNGVETLVFASDAEPTTFASAALARALSRASTGEIPVAELEPSVLTDSVIARLNRAAPPVSAVAAANADGDSDARWFWVAAIILLAGEWLIRRRADAGRAQVTA